MRAVKNKALSGPIKQKLKVKQLSIMSLQIFKKSEKSVKIDIFFKYLQNFRLAY